MSNEAHIKKIIPGKWGYLLPNGERGVSGRRRDCVAAIIAAGFVPQRRTNKPRAPVGTKDTENIRNTEKRLVLRFNHDQVRVTVSFPRKMKVYQALSINAKMIADLGVVL